MLAIILGRWRWLRLLTALCLCAAFAQAQAAKILVLTTAESARDAIDIQNNCKAEFLALGPTHTVVVLDGKLNDDVTPLTSTDLSPAAGPYDVVVTCTVYNAANTQAVNVISTGMKQRTARAFFLFDEQGSFFPAFRDAKLNWTLGSGTLYAGQGVPQILNARSIYSSAFSDLTVMGGNSYSSYSGVPINNTLYTPRGYNISPTDTSVSAASTMVVPTTESYLDANGTAQGACLFDSTDVSMFDSVRYGGNQNKIAAAFLKAIEPGGACSLVPSISKGFDQTSLVPGGTSVLTIKLQNNGGYTDAQGTPHPAAPVSDVNVLDHLPTPLQLASAPTTTCTGSKLVGAPGDTVVGISAGTLPPTGCSIIATVVWPATTAGKAACLGASQPVTNTIQPGVDFTTAIGQAPAAATATIACTPSAVLAVEKSTTQTQIAYGGTAIFTVRVNNIGNAAANNVQISDPLTADWSSMGWICSAAGGASCPTSSGSGSISQTVVSLPVDGSLTYTINAVASGVARKASNTVTITPGSVVCNASICTATATVAVLNAVTPVPGLKHWALALLASILLLGAARAIRSHRT